MHPLATALALLAGCGAGLIAPGLAAAQTDVSREQLVRRAPPQLTKAPVLLRFVEADYPALAQQRGLAGPVALEVTIDAGGQVTTAAVLSAPDPSLGAAALAAVRRFVFSPAEIDGRPAPLRLRYVYRFVLQATFEPRLPAWLNDLPAGSGGAAAAAPRAPEVVVGRVREQGTRLPLAGAAIALPELGLELRADARGRFGVPRVAPGLYRVRAVSPTHKPETVLAAVRPGEQTTINFYLEPLNDDPFVTVVRGARRKTSVSRVTLAGRELTTVPGTFGDPVRVVQNLPGLARAPYIAGALLIRGAAPEDSGTYLDGIEIPQLFHFLGGPSVLNPEFIERVDYYAGNADARYGRLIAGVVDLSSRSTQTRRLRGAVDVNLLNAGIFLATPVSERVSVAAALRRSYIDALLPPILAASSRKATTVVPVYYDYQGRVEIRLRGSDRLSLLAFGSDDQLDIATNEPEDDTAINFDSKLRFHRLVASWQHAFAGGRGSSRLQPFIGVDSVGFGAGSARVKILSLGGGLREDAELRLAPGALLRFGADIALRQASFDAQIPLPAPYRNPAAPAGGNEGPGGGSGLTAEVQPVRVDQLLGSVGTYVGAVLDLTGRLQLLPSARVEAFFYYDQNLRLAVDPRLTARYRLDAATVLKGGAGLYTKAPEPQESNAFTGNPNLVLAHAAQFSAGVERTLFRPEILFDAQVYFNYRYDNPVPTEEVIVGAEGVRPRRWVSDGEGYSYGLELLLKHDVTRRFYGWVAYTLSWARQQQLASDPPARFVFDQRHILTLVGSYRFGRGWETGLRFRLVSGRPRTPVLGGLLDGDGGFYRPILGAEGGADEPLFHQLDLRVEKGWLFDLWRFSVYLDVQNVYNAENPEATLYDYRFREAGPLRGLPLLPTLGIKGSF
ncbi:MAG: TonB-dependent receptor [Proteobacteria bacterium]|nr:TonB-dependent receptor [Pseudomonadota bacterium]